MIEGEFRRGLPRVTLTIPGIQEDVEVEFIVDTGFDGDLALPARIALRRSMNAPETKIPSNSKVRGN